ncbi:malic acid transporter [Pyrenophora seminiperda CCB06]|uniref:Malic acid transporter n=1 Tax=Pyrenophora seminiperda CCB06 TaxID=1302712 RepID=A0A3M7MD64_9PLEO|nr:malic acid transporter [Pyrenophora seminiperda CCB06]
MPHDVTRPNLNAHVLVPTFPRINRGHTDTSPLECAKRRAKRAMTIDDEMAPHSLRTGWQVDVSSTLWNNMRFRDRTRAKYENADEKPPEEVGLRDRLVHFTWPWFACTMSTGSIAVVLGNTPNKFTGLKTIGKVVFILDLVLFTIFTICMLVRFILVPRKIIASLRHSVEGLFFGTYWVSVALILNCTYIYGDPSTGPWLTKALEITYWMYCAAAFLVGIVQYSLFFRLERLSVSDAVPAWIFPIYPLLVVGTLAGTILPGQPETAGRNIFVGAVLFQGLAWAVSFLLYSHYMQRLMTSELPSPTTRPGMYVSVGPAGYTAAGLLSLANQAPSIVPANYFTSISIPDGEIVRIIGIMSGLFIILFAYWFFMITTIAVLLGSRSMSFSLNWWAFIFPNAGLTLATIQAGKVLQSQGINGVASALTILLIIMWLLTAAFCIRAVVLGEILWPGKDEDKTMKKLAWGWQGNKGNPEAGTIRP